MMKIKKQLYYSVVVASFVCGIGISEVLHAIQKRELTPLQVKVVAEAQKLLESAEVSYVFGGYSLGDPGECKSCNECLEQKKPLPKARILECPICSSCSLDCSHFIQLVFNEAFREGGLKTHYLTSADMLALNAATLKKRYKYIDLGRDVKRAEPGDLLVYRGHVVMLEALSSVEIIKLSEQQKHKTNSSALSVRGDIIHATGGLAIRSPGAAIQRERFVDLADFRGPLQRILRHQAFYLKKI